MNPLKSALRILHLEDSDADAELVRESLAEDGLDGEVVRATDGASFEAALARGPWDLVLADFNVPRLDGLAALAMVRDRDKEVPFICVSGTIGEERAVQLLRSGATDYVLKQALDKLPMAIRRAQDEAREKRRAAEAELALAEKEALLGEIVGTIDEVFWVLTPALDRVLYVSPGFERVWGRPQAQALSDFALLLDAIEPEDRAAVQAFMTRAPAQPQEIQHRIRRPDGKLRWIRALTYPVRDASGKILRIVAVSSDITDRKEMEQNFLQAQKMEAVGRLAGGVAHDFNNLLTVIGGYTELLLGRLGPSDPARAQVEEVQRAGERGSALTRQLLAFSRKQVYVPTRVDLGEVARGMVRMLERLLGEEVRIDVEAAPGLRPVMADRGQIEQVLLNLAVNARDAMPRGGRIGVSISNAAPGAGTGPQVLLSVSDSGTGIAPELLPRLFEPFFTTKEPGKGTGLGLATVHGIVTHAGGRVEVESEVGRGTTFRVYLPAVEGEVRPVELPAKTPAAASGTAVILVADDSDAVRRLACEVLSQSGYRVLEASSGEEAARMSRKHPGPIHLLLTDMVMDGMTGPELAVQIAGTRKECRILFMSGYTEEAEEARDLIARGASFIEKPFAITALKRKVEELLRGGGPL